MHSKYTIINDKNHHIHFVKPIISELLFNPNQLHLCRGLVSDLSDKALQKLQSYIYIYIMCSYPLSR